MKHLILILILSAACTKRTEYGECIGINGFEKPGLVYKYSAKNIFLALLFAGLIYPPIKVVLDELECPVAEKTGAEK